MRSFLKRTAILTNVICAIGSLGSAQSASFNQGSATPFSMLQSVNRPARLASFSNRARFPGLPSGITVPSTAVSANNVQTMPFLGHLRGELREHASSENLQHAPEGLVGEPQQRRPGCDDV